MVYRWGMKNHRSSRSGDSLGRNPIKAGKPRCPAEVAFPALTNEATVSLTVFGILSSLPGLGN